MELTTIAGYAAGPFLTILLGWLFTITARIFYKEWDQSLIPNGAKVAAAPIVGFGLGVLGMYADTILLNPPLQINIVSWIKYGFAGFLLGALAIGLNEMRKGGGSSAAEIRTYPLPSVGAIPPETKGVSVSKVIPVLILFVGVSLATTACAMGPIYVAPKTAAWDAVPGATGYHIYWRAPGVTTWDDAQRLTTNATSVNLIDGGIPQGQWEICATALDGVSESGPSNIVSWSYGIIRAPTNNKVQ